MSFQLSSFISICLPFLAECVCAQDEAELGLRLLLGDLEGGQLENIVNIIVIDVVLLLSVVVHVHVLQTYLVGVDGEQLSPQEASTGISLMVKTGPGGLYKVLEDGGKVGNSMMDMLLMILPQDLAAEDLKADEV